jgi:hypothetical protein
MKILDYLYFGIYRFLQKTNAKEVVEYVSFLWLGGLISINIIVIVRIMDQNKMLIDIIPPRIFGSVICIFTFILFYFIFIRNQRYIQIVERYANDSEHQKVIQGLVVIFYFIISFVAVILV